MDFPKSVPGVGLVGDRFVDEDAAVGQQGSLIPAAWGNAVTLEIVNVILAAGLEPEEGDVTQLAQAIAALVPSAPVTSVAGKTGAVTLVKADVGLGSVENYAVATQAEAQAGTLNTRYMTPPRVWQAIAAWWATVSGTKQNTLVSGTNIRTLNGQTLLGSGDISLLRLVFSASLGLTGTSVSIPDIPSWATRVGFHFVNAGTDTAAQPPMIRLGRSAAIVAGGYLGSVGMTASSGANTVDTSTGVPVQIPNATYWPASARVGGSIYFVKRPGTDQWVWEGGTSNENLGSYTFASYTRGRVSLGGALTQAQITTPGGTATFTAGGTVFLTFEG